MLKRDFDRNKIITKKDVVAKVSEESGVLGKSTRVNFLMMFYTLYGAKYTSTLPLEASIFNIFSDIVPLLMFVSLPSLSLSKMISP